MNRIILILSCVFAVLLSNCKKKEIQGPKGDPGIDGSNGNSNIKSTDPFPIIFSQWTADSSAYAWKTSVNLSMITKDVVDKGSVKMFIQSGGTWKELPFLVGDTFEQFSFDVGVVNILVENVHLTWPQRPLTAYYRLVIVT